MRVYTHGQAKERLDRLSSWSLDNDHIVRDIRAPSYMDALRWLTAIADHAEGLEHHPDVHWVYTRLTFRLTTHDAGGLTDKDFELAARIDGVVDEGFGSPAVKP